MGEDSKEMKPPSLSTVIIAQDEVDRIGRLLQSLSFVDEIVVVDSGSTDGTQRLCEQSGARVVHHPWPGFAAQKQFALEQATGEWVLNLDADEAVPADLAADIQAAIRKAPASTAGYEMPRLSRYLGRWIRHGGWYPDRQLRLVRNGRAQWKQSDLHERLVVDGDVSRLDSPLHHFVYRDISDQIRTIDRYSSIHAHSHGPAAALYAVWGVFRAVGKFLECYLWKLGLLDGIPGLIIAMNSSWYVFLKHAKAWEQSIPETLP